MISHFVHIRGKDNILADAISRLCMMNVYEKEIEDKQHHLLGSQTATYSNVKVEQIQHLDSSTLPQLLNMNTTTLCNLQKQDKFCKNKVRELHVNIDDRFYLNTDSILK